MMGASVLPRLSPLLVLAAALVALAVFFVHDSQPAAASHEGKEIWAATLSPAGAATGNRGCWGTDNTACSGALTPQTFMVDGETYQVESLIVSNNGFLNFTFNRALFDGAGEAILVIGSTHLAFADGTVGADRVSFGNTGLNWGTVNSVQVSLFVLPPATTTTPTEEAPKPRPRVFPDLDELPVVPEVEERGTHAPYCYIGEGNGMTEYIRYPNGRIEETTRQSDAIRSMFACD